MKTLSLSIFAAAAACGFASAQTAFTTPVGYETVSLPSSVEYNLLGLRLQSPTVASGDFETVSGSVLTDTDVTFSVTSGRTYILEITNSAAPGIIGVIQEVPAASISGSTITTPQNLGALGLVAGDTYRLRVAPTLEELFVGPVVLNGFTAGQADNVWIPDGVGGYTKYFRSSLSGNPWRNAATNQNTPNVPVVYVDGILIQKRSASPTSSLVVTGEVKTTKTIAIANAGTVSSPSFNLLSTVYPAGSTLQNSGIKGSLLTGFTAGAADNVWVPNGTGGYTKYYVSSLAGNPWRFSANNTNVSVDVPLSSGIIIERKAPAVNINFTPPPSYSGL